jgi:hypothetical protein
VKFERHANVTYEVMSLTSKLFIAQYINTAMLSLIINGDISQAGGNNVYIDGIGNTNKWIQFGFFTGANMDYDLTW